MLRKAVGLLAAVGAAMSALTGLVHNGFVWLILMTATVAMGLAAYLAVSPKKKCLIMVTIRSSTSTQRMFPPLGPSDG